MEILQLSALEIGRKIKNKEISVKETLEVFYKETEKKDKEIHAFITLNKEEAFTIGDTIQKEIDMGKAIHPFAGVPLGIKDNICTQGIKTTCASRILENFIPVYDAFAIAQIKKAGMIPFGKTNMDEFAMGSTTETSYFGITKNPWDVTRVPGGSSGGTCAAVAAKEVPLALGSDTGGSIRQPCSFCGVTGIKPTYGTISRNGLIAYGSSLDQIGPVGKDVSDCVHLLDVLSGYDVKDSTSIKRKENMFATFLKEDVKGLRVGIPRDYFGPGLQEDIKDLIYKGAALLEKRGAIIEEFDLGLTEYAIPAYYVIASAEASSNLARFDGVKFGYRAEEYEDLHDMYKKTRSQGFGSEVKRRIMLGSFVLSSGYYDAYYLKALKTKALIKKAFDKAFQEYDILLAPVAPTTAPEIGKSLEDPLKMYLGDVYTISVNLAGLPAMSIPWGKDHCGLPVGMQIIADCFQEEKMIRAGYVCEQGKEEVL